MSSLGALHGLRIYVAGPLNGSGNHATNVDTAGYVAAQLLRAGFNPFVPHSNSQWMRNRFTEAECLAWDFSWLDRCVALLRLEGVSPGSDAEVRRAESRNMHVVYAVDHNTAALATSTGCVNLAMAVSQALSTPL